MDAEGEHAGRDHVCPHRTIGGIIYVGGASDYQGGTVVDTTNSFSFDPAANTIGTIAAIPRATGETRGLNFNGQMCVMGGGQSRAQSFQRGGYL